MKKQYFVYFTNDGRNLLISWGMYLGQDSHFNWYV